MRLSRALAGVLAAGGGADRVGCSACSLTLCGFASLYAASANLCDPDTAVTATGSDSAMRSHFAVTAIMRENETSLKLNVAQNSKGHLAKCTSANVTSVLTTESTFDYFIASLNQICEMIPNPICKTLIRSPSCVVKKSTRCEEMEVT